jgi:hypothetical protein
MNPSAGFHAANDGLITILWTLLSNIKKLLINRVFFNQLKYKQVFKTVRTVVITGHKQFSRRGKNLKIQRHAPDTLDTLFVAPHVRILM